MVHIYVDDVRPAPNGFIRFFTVDDTISYIRNMYRGGNTHFYIDLDNDAGEEYAARGGDYINILNRLEDMRHGGKIRNMKAIIHIHSMNAVAADRMRAIINSNHSWMEEDKDGALR